MHPAFPAGLLRGLFVSRLCAWDLGGGSLIFDGSCFPDVPERSAAGDQVHLLVVIAHQHRDIVAGMDTSVSVPILIEDEPNVEKQHVRPPTQAVQLQTGSLLLYILFLDSVLCRHLDQPNQMDWFSLFTRQRLPGTQMSLWVFSLRWICLFVNVLVGACIKEFAEGRAGEGMCWSRLSRED